MCSLLLNRRRSCHSRSCCMPLLDACCPSGLMHWTRPGPATPAGMSTESATAGSGTEDVTKAKQLLSGHP
jgi:hypothetical protein